MDERLNTMFQNQRKPGLEVSNNSKVQDFFYIYRKKSA